MQGEIASVDTASNAFTISLPVAEGPETLSIGTNGATVYQGINDFSALATGTFVELDVALQSDGSLLATRVAVEDTAAVNVVTGPLTNVNAAPPDIMMVGREEQGVSFPSSSFPSISGEVFGGFVFNAANAVFQVSGQLTNLQNLPFTPSFNASNMVAGQNIYLSAPEIPPANPEVAARTITLIPQTIDGTITATSNSGSFAVYNVTLAPYDPFPNMGAAPLQKSYVTNPNQVEVYTDTNTQMLNSESLAIGNTLRFNGLIFNDNGTLRMDCAQINDGVTQ